jgi:hypothetical protein
MAITYVSSAEQNTTSDTTPITMTTDIGTRTDGLLIACVATIDTITHTHASPTWNGVAMGTAASYVDQTSGSYMRVSMYYLANPANGSNTFSLTYDDGFGGSSQAAASYVVLAWFDGAHQTQASVLDDFESGDGSTDPTLTLTPTTNNQLLVSMYASEDDAILTPGQTVLQTQDNGTRTHGASYLIQTTAAPQAMTWTGTDANWIMVAASFKAAASDTPPTVALNTADGGTLSSTPTLAFTGTASSTQPIRYQVQISTDSGFDDAEIVADEVNYLDASVGGLHPNGVDELTWDAVFQVDDRFGQSFEVTTGGLLRKLSTHIGMDEVDVDGTAVVRIYNHAGVYGTTSAPANAADPEDTPTPGWLAESDPIAIVYPAGPTGWLEFEFTGDDLLWLEPGYYIWICDWRPDAGIYTNAIELSGDLSPTHAGNAYIDGRNESNNGPRLDFDVYFGALMTPHQLDVVSGTDSGFTGTPDSTDPFTSAQQVTFTVQSGDELYAGQTYYWRVRGIDPAGTNVYGDWTTARQFVVGSSTIAALSGTIRRHMATHLAR